MSQPFEELGKIKFKAVVSSNNGAKERLRTPQGIENGKSQQVKDSGAAYAMLIGSNESDN